MKRDLKVNFNELQNISVAARGFQYSINDINSALDNIKNITYQDSGCLNDAVTERIESFRKNTEDISDFLVSVHNIIDEYCEAQQKYLTPECIAVPVESDRDSLYFKLEDIKHHISELKVITMQNELCSFFTGNSEDNTDEVTEDPEIETKKQNKQSNYFKIKEICENVIPDHISKINSEINNIDSIYENNVKKFENSDDDYKSKLKSIYKYFKNINFYRKTAYIKLMIASALETVRSFIRNTSTNITISFTESILTVNSALRKNDKKYCMSENELKMYYGYTYGSDPDFSDMKCAGSELERFPKVPNTKTAKSKEPYTEYELTHQTVFNTKISRKYGGDQGAPKNIDKNSSEYIMMYDIASKNNSMVTPDNFDAYLQKMNSEGCGYVSLVNGIMCHYENDPEEFEKIFGYPMYKSDNTLNYECLLTDIYSSYDNYFLGTEISIDDYDPFEDGLPSGYSYAEDTTGGGTSSYQRHGCLKAFMADHGIQAETKTLNYLCPENFKEITYSGKTVLVSLERGNLEYENGNLKQTVNSHSIVVTGFTEDGRIIVSSWGERLFIDPNDPERATHTSKITGKEVLYNSGPNLSFETLEIK